jgi:hypothetical protein
MAGSQLAEIRRLCSALPDTAETMTWGQPHFRVGRFSPASATTGKVHPGLQARARARRRGGEGSPLRPGSYVGARGCSAWFAGIRDWEEVRAFLVESYRLIAPRRCWEAYLAGAAGEAKGVQRGAARSVRSAGTRSGTARRKPAARAKPAAKARRGTIRPRR